MSPRFADPSSNPLLNARAAATILGVNIYTLSNWRRTGNGPPYVIPALEAKAKRRACYYLSDLHAWLVQRAAQPPRPLPRHYRATSRVDRPPRLARTPQGLDRTEGAPAALEDLWRAIQAVGSIRKWAKQNNLSDHIIKQVLNGTKMIPPNVAAVIGYRCLRIVRYVKLTPKP